LPQPRSDDARRHRGDSGWYVAEEDRRHHRCPALRAVSLDARAAHVHPEEERETAAARHANVVGQAPSGGDPNAVGGVLRTALQCPLPRFPARTRMSPRPAGSLLQLAGTVWFIEGDLRGGFDTIKHRKLMKLLRHRVNDEKLLDLIWK